MKTDDVLDRLERAKAAMSGPYFDLILDMAIAEIKKLRGAIESHRERSIASDSKLARALDS